MKTPATSLGGPSSGLEHRETKAESNFGQIAQLLIEIETWRTVTHNRTIGELANR
jgi:hypothetical protein